MKYIATSSQKIFGLSHIKLYHSMFLGTFVQVPSMAQPLMSRLEMLHASCSTLMVRFRKERSVQP